MSKVTYKIWRPTGEIYEIAGGTANGWEEYSEEVVNVTDQV
jgi:hypothetical protein